VKEGADARLPALPTDKEGVTTDTKGLKIPHEENLNAKPNHPAPTLSKTTIHPPPVSLNSSSQSPSPSSPTEEETITAEAVSRQIQTAVPPRTKFEREREQVKARCTKEKEEGDRAGQRVSQDDSGIGCDTSLEILSGLGRPDTPSSRPASTLPPEEQLMVNTPRPFSS